MCNNKYNYFIDKTEYYVNNITSNIISSILVTSIIIYYLSYGLGVFVFCPNETRQSFTRLEPFSQSILTGKSVVVSPKTIT